MPDPFVELRGEVLREHVDIIDAVMQATPGASRMSILREIVAEWVEDELHRSMLVQRVANSNGNATELNRSRTGVEPEVNRKRLGVVPE